ncbi:hypothetical protein BGZ97_009610 [Linnemannia gamsii]|uniref:non-specific serine/threonine protein kinase n=1 Tax=Linnemannia gamsii TaxID=64522 RepID=A0A9P6UPW7_9FUNG|nr:hypothetical protein BGZ97_009610 [Linnemannia gamsii]
MSTSCGSPCYAAPELVISDGLYVGSGVDIWSCGVILYAMLAGYLPFDDDPSNPDGDNINQLYNYILATTLVFPDYISHDAKDLLRMMLVPDPAKRCNMKRIMAHRWLRPYAPMFQYSIEDLEAQAMARLNGTIWIPPKQSISVDLRDAPQYLSVQETVQSRTGPPRLDPSEVNSKRRHTFVAETTVPESQPSWAPHPPTPRYEMDEDSLVPVSDTSMDICDDEADAVNNTINNQLQAEQGSAGFYEGIQSDVAPEMAMVVDSKETSFDDRSIVMEGSSIGGVGQGSYQENGCQGNHVPAEAGNTSLDIQPQTIPAIITSQSSSSLATPPTSQTGHGAQSSTFEATYEMPSTVEGDALKPRAERQSVRKRQESNNGSTLEASPTISRRPLPHDRIRPTTIHGEPMPHDSVKTPPDSPPPIIPTRRDSLGMSQSFQFPPIQPTHFQQGGILTNNNAIASQPLIQGQSLQSATSPNGNSSYGGGSGQRNSTYVKTHRKGPSSGRFLGFLGGLSKKNGEHHSHGSQTPTSPRTTSVYEPSLADIDSPYSSPQQQTYRRNIQPNQDLQILPSTPLPEKRATPSTPTSQHYPHLQTQVQQQQQQQLQQQQQQHSGVVTAAYDTQKPIQSQRGKRRKTLSLVAGSGERPPHHQQQQMQLQSLHHPISSRPPLPSAGASDGSAIGGSFGSTAATSSMNGSGIGAHQSQPHGSSSGPAQRIIGWLRRKSVVKSGAEVPYFDPAEFTRTSGTTPSPVPFSGSNGHTPTKGHVSPSGGPVGGDGFTSVTEEYESGPGGAAGSSVNGMMISPCGAQDISTSTTPTNIQLGGSQDAINNNNPMQALQQSHGTQEPTLQALIHALPPNWTDAKLKVHSGAVELSSLSSRHPAEIMYDIKTVVLRLGIEIRSDSDFKIKCVRRKRKTSSNSAASGSNGAGAGATGAGSGSVNGGGGHGGMTSLSVKSLLQGHGLHYHHNSNSTKGGPDDTASVMSSNLSIDREAWVSARSVLGGAGAGVMQGPGSVIGTGTSVSGKKKSGIRTMLWRNSTSASLASASSPTPSPTSPTSGNGAISMGGGTAMVTQGSGSSTRQLSQVMNGSSLGVVASPQSQQHFVGGGSGGSGCVSTTAAGNGLGQGVVDSVATDHDSAVPSSSLVAGGDGTRNLRPGSVVGISSSTTATTIGAATMSQSTAVVPPLQQLQQQQAILAATTTPTSVDGVTSTGDNGANVVAAVEPLYGEESIDSGEEIRFSIELCRMKNLRGLYSVDIRRVKGNRWAYKFLYHAILNTLDLQGKGGYLVGGLVPAHMAGLAGGSGAVGAGGVGGSVAAPTVAMSVR